MRRQFSKIGLVALAILPLNPIQGGLFDLYHIKKSPYAATIAHKVGDILSVKVKEKAYTTNDGKSETTRNSDHSWNLTKLFLPGVDVTDGFTRTMGSGDQPGLGFINESTFDAEGKNSSKHIFETVIPVRIIEEITEGQYVVRGKRLLNINGKEKTLFITGVIRQEDIEIGNEISSDKVVDAVIEMDGEIASKELKAGVLTRIWNVLF